MNDLGKKKREWIFLIFCIGLTALAVLRFDSLLALLGKGFLMLKPFLIGASMAFVINLPLKVIEKKQ